MTTPMDPASLPQPPRRIHRRRGYFLLVIHHVFLLLLLMFVCTVWLIGVGTVKMLWLSEVVPAHVTKVSLRSGERGPDHELLVVYRFDAVDYSATLRVGAREAERHREGDSVQVQLLAERPDRPHMYYEHYPARLVTFLMGCLVLLPSLGLAKLIWDLYIAPWKVRRLLRQGAATIGIIVSKQERRGRTTKHTVSYEYQATGADRSAVTINSTMRVPTADFEAAQNGDKVIVLYDPHRPHRSVIYNYTDYEVVR